MKTLKILALTGGFAFGMVAISPPASAQTSQLGGLGGVVSDARVAQLLGLTTKVIEQLRKAFGLTNFEISKLKRQSLSRLLMKLAHPNWLSDRRLLANAQSGSYQKRAPSQALFRASRNARLLRDASFKKSRVAGIPVGDGLLEEVQIKAADWKELGPGNIGGRTRSIIVDPANPSTMWLASMGGGIWKTTDAGASWAQIDDFFKNLVVSSLAMNPKKEDVLYAGTGEGYSNVVGTQGAVGAGIFRSSDRGKTWQQLPSTAKPSFDFVNRIAISPDGKTILAATAQGIFRNSNEEAAWGNVNGNLDVLDIDFHPTDPRFAIAGTKNGRVLYSDNGGEKWKPSKIWVKGPLDAARVEVTYAVANPSIVYASVDVQSGEIWRSEDGGLTFNLMSPKETNYLGAFGFHGNVVWAGDPKDANLVVVGGLDIWRSTDGGKTLTKISDWEKGAKSVHADQHVIVPHPNYDGVKNHTVFFGNDGGIYRASNVRTVSITAGWQELNNRLYITQFYGIAGHPKGAVIGGTQDNGTIQVLAASGSENWTEIVGGDGGFCAVNPANPKQYFGEYTNLQIFRGRKGGPTFELITGQMDWVGETTKYKAPPYLLGDVATGSANFIAPFILDPNKGDRLLAGGLSLWRTNDASAPVTQTKGPQWAAIKAPIGTDVWTEAISAIAVAKGASNIVWVGHNNGALFMTSIGNASAKELLKPESWEHFNVKNTELPARIVSRIAIDPANRERVFVTYNGFESDNVWLTTDGGKSWKNIGATLPKAPVQTIAVHPSKSNYVYVGTNVGFFASDDGGNSWTPTNRGPTNAAVYDLLFVGTRLVAATHGRGVWEIDLPSGDKPVVPPPACEKPPCDKPPVEKLTLRERIVKAAVGEIGIVKSVPGPDGLRQGWANLVDYYKVAYKAGYEPAWEKLLKQPNGRVNMWSGIFAVWAVQKGGRADVSWKKPQGGVVPIPLTWRKDAKPGDIVVASDGKGGSRFAILESVAADGYHVISGDYVWGTVDRRVFKAKEVGAYYSVGD